MVRLAKVLGLLAVISTAMLSRASFAANPTLATSISSFEGTEEPTVLYHPSNATFTNDSYVNMTNQTGGIVRFTLRYNPASDWWDGDRSTTNDDRQRAEVKGLGVHQKNGETFIYSMDWRTNATFVGGSGFDHIFQLKSTDGDSGAPLVTLDPGKGTGSSGSVRIWSGTAANSSTVRTFTWSPGVWQHADILIHTATDNTGAVTASINGDAFSGKTNLP